MSENRNTLSRAGVVVGVLAFALMGTKLGARIGHAAGGGDEGGVGCGAPQEAGSETGGGADGGAAPSQVASQAVKTPTFPTAAPVTEAPMSGSLSHLKLLTAVTLTGSVSMRAEKPGECSALSVPAAEQAIEFTERPARKATSRTVGDLTAQWSHLYPNVAPNAELQVYDEGGDARTVVVQLRSAPTWDGKTLSFAQACVTDAGTGAGASKPLSDFAYGGLFLEDGVATASRTIAAWKPGTQPVTELRPALSRVRDGVELLGHEPRPTDNAPPALASMRATGTPRFKARKPGDCSALSFTTEETYTAFTERPAREAARFPLPQLVSSWSTVFASSSPNAALQVFDDKGTTASTAIVELRGAPVWDARARTVTFPRACLIQIAGEAAAPPPSGTFAGGSLFIDSSTVGVYDSCYEFPWDGANANPLCADQWGSYPLQCTSQNAQGLANAIQYVPGAQCPSITVKDGICDGTFNLYRANVSANVGAPTYECNDEVAASNVSWSVNSTGATATGTYTYSSGGFNEQFNCDKGIACTTYQWTEWNEDPVSFSEILGGNIVSTSSTAPLTSADTGKFLQFCVTPADSGGATGSQACSEVLQIASEVEVTEISYISDIISGDLYVGVSVRTSATVGSPTLATLWYTASDSSGTGAALYTGATASEIDGTNLVLAPKDHVQYVQACVTPSDGSYTGAQVCTAWTSTQVASASNVAVTAADLTVTGSYTFADSAKLSESGTTLQWYSATDDSGDGSTAISGATSETYTVTSVGAYLMFCVTPSDGTWTGASTCSGWTIVGNPGAAAGSITWYSAANQTGTATAESITDGACVNMSTLGLVGATLSVALAAPAASEATLDIYAGSNCSGTLYTRTAGAGTVHDINLSTVGIGTGTHSYKVTW